jgi:hypothetical protein
VNCVFQKPTPAAPVLSSYLLLASQRVLPLEYSREPAGLLRSAAHRRADAFNVCFWHKADMARLSSNAILLCRTTQLSLTHGKVCSSP